MLLVTVAFLALTAALPAGASRSVCVMICFTGMVVATLAQLRFYPLTFGAGRSAAVPHWLVLDPMGWVFTTVILLIATAAVMTRRLRSYSGQGDLRFCLLITLSTMGWSLLPELQSLPVMAGCMLLGSLPLAMQSTLGAGDDFPPFTTVALPASLLAMLLALAALAMGCFGLHIGQALITAPQTASAWGGVLVVFFITPMLFWAGSLPLIWWYGSAAGDAPAPVVLFLLLVPAIGSSGPYMRIMHCLISIAPAAANVVTLTVICLGALAVVAYGIKALFQFIVPDILGNIVGIFASCTFVTLAAGMSFSHVALSDLVGCVLLYALTVGIAVGSSVGIIGRQSLGLNQQWPSFARVKPLHALLLLLALLSLGGLPPTLGGIARIELFLAVGPGSALGLAVLGINVLGILLGGGAAMRIGAYALMGMPEITPPQAVTDKRRKKRRLTAGVLLLLTAAGVLNGLALPAYNPIHQLATAFAPAWGSR